MKSKTAFLLILIILLLSCGEKKNSRKTTELEKNTERIIEEKIEDSNIKISNSIIKSPIKTNTECKCFSGIGSTEKETPTLIFNFTDGNSVSVCGYFDSENQGKNGIIMSEFNVFDCSNGKSYAEYGATQTCRIRETKEELIIEELYYLPSGKNWDWKLIQIGEQTISTDKNGVNVSKIKPKIKPINIDQNLQNDFVNSIKKGEGISSEWEIEIGKLTVLSLSGNKIAWSILKDYENYTGEQTDGALAETWKDAVAIVKWIKKE